METPAEALLTSPYDQAGMHDFSGMADAGGMGYPPSPLIGPWPRVRMRGRRLQTPTLCITGLFNPRSKSYNFLVRRTSGIPNQGGKNVTYQAFEDGSVPMTLLALLSTAVPVASAQETTDESFYELTTTRRAGDMIVGEPGTTILFDSSNGELVDVLPPSEAEDYSVTVSRGCADSNAGCWAGGNALGDMQFAGTGTATGSWPYRNSYTTGNKSGQITFAINGVTYTLSQLVRGCASPRQTALASTAYPLPAGKDVFLNFGPVSSGCRPFAFPAFSQAESVASRAPAHADVERVGGVGEVPCLLHVGFGLFFGLFAFAFASRSSSRVLNLSVSAFFVLMGFGGSCGACGGVSRACGRSCGLSAGSGLEGACGAPEGRWRRLTAVRMPCAWSESRPIMALSASRSRFRA